MDIREIKQAKEKLESELLSLIKKFETSTETSIRGITLTTDRRVGDTQSRVGHLSVAVRI